jgi:hypothetical protein
MSIAKRGVRGSRAGAATILVAGLVAGVGAAVVVAVPAAAVPTATPTPTASSRRTSGPVVLVLVPQLTWATAPTSLDAFAKANLSMRTADADSDAEDVYLTLGKGARSAHPGRRGDDAVPPVDRIHDNTGDNTGDDTADSGLVLADWADLVRYDRSLDYGGTLGLLGGALQAAGRRWGLVSSDGRAAPVAAAPNGIVPLAYPGTADGLQAALLAQLDAVFVAVPAGGLETVLPLLARSCTIVASATTPGGSRHLGVVATSTACGLGAGGLRSSSTHHAALATLPDVTATFLHAVGARVPSEVAGSVLAASAPVRRDVLVERDRRTWTVDHLRGSFVWLYVLLNVIGAAVVVLLPRWRAAACAILLGIPAASFLMTLVPWWRGGWWGGLLAGGGFAALIGFVALVVMRRDVVVGLCLVTASTAAVVAVDAVLGGPLEVDAPFGNSPVVAGRFFGVGNIASGFLVGGLVIAATLALSRWGRPATGVVALAFVVGLIAGSAPQFGADVGGALFAVPAYGLVLLGTRPRRITVRDVILIVSSALVAVLLFVAVDLARHAGSQTHLAKSLGHGGLVDTLERKAGSALATVLGPMALIVVVGAVVLVLTRFSPGPTRIVRIGALAVVLAAVLGSALNDSGLNVGAAVVAVAWPAAVMLESHVAAAPAVPDRVPA